MHAAAAKRGHDHWPVLFQLLQRKVAVGILIQHGVNVLDLRAVACLAKTEILGGFLLAHPLTWDIEVGEIRQNSSIYIVTDPPNRASERLKKCEILLKNIGSGIRKT